MLHAPAGNLVGQGVHSVAAVLLLALDNAPLGGHVLVRPVLLPLGLPQPLPQEHRLLLQLAGSVQHGALAGGQRLDLLLDRSLVRGGWGVCVCEGAGLPSTPLLADAHLDRLPRLLRPLLARPGGGERGLHRVHEAGEHGVDAPHVAGAALGADRLLLLGAEAVARGSELEEAGGVLGRGHPLALDGLDDAVGAGERVLVRAVLLQVRLALLLALHVARLDLLDLARDAPLQRLQLDPLLLHLALLLPVPRRGRHAAVHRKVLLLLGVLHRLVQVAELQRRAGA